MVPDPLLSQLPAQAAPAAAPASEHQPEHDEYVVDDHHAFYIDDAEGDHIAQLHVFRRHGVRWVSNLWVHHEHRRRGHAKRLLSAALATYGADDLYLQVLGYAGRPLADHQLAFFYAQYGFESVPEAPGMMRRPGAAPSPPS